MKTGTIPAVDATGQHHRQILVRENEDGTIDYLVGDSARSRDGWASLPKDLVSEIQWNKTS
jgi:hypothetical protein